MFFDFNDLYCIIEPIDEMIDCPSLLVMMNKYTTVIKHEHKQGK